jgi:hypothetical protein
MADKVKEFDPSVVGLVHVSGPVGVGKTAFALGCGADPNRIALCNWDVKDPGIALGANMDFLYMLQTNNELFMAEAAMEFFAGIEENQYDALILDGWELLYSALPAYVMKNAKKLKSYWYGGGTGEWGTRQKLGYRKYLEPAILDWLQQKVPLIFVINQLTYMYRDKVRTEKKVPDTSDGVIQKSVMRLFIQENGRLPQSATPSALVLKNLPKRKWNKETRRIESINVLPRRLDVRALKDWEHKDYISLWELVDHYLANPVLNRELAEHERWDDLEESIVYQTLSVDEQEAYDFAKKLALVTQDEELRQGILQLNNEGVSPLKIASQLGTTVATVKTILEIVNGDE